MSLSLQKEQIELLLHSFIDNASFYKIEDFEKVREAIAVNYDNDFEIFLKISQDAKARELLASNKLIIQIVSKIGSRQYNFSNGDHELSLLEACKQLNEYSEQYYTNTTYLSLLDFLTFTVESVQQKITSQGDASKYSGGINDLFDLFKRTILRINLDQSHQANFQQLFNQVTVAFTFGSYQNANLWFRFFFLSQKINGLPNNILRDWTRGIINFIKGVSSDLILKESVESVMSIEDFFKTYSNYLDLVLQRAINELKFAITFYDFFSSEIKQNLIENWSSKSKAEFDQFLDVVKGKIPDKIKLVKLILQNAEIQSNVSIREGIFDSLFKLKLSPDEMKDTNYSKIIINMICSNNINYNRSGIMEYKQRSKFVDTVELKNKAIPFLTSIISNLNSYHEIFQNILMLKIGIDKRTFDSEIRKNVNQITHLSNYLINSGNANFYQVLTSKLLNETIGIIGDNILIQISDKDRYGNLINELKNNRQTLSESGIEKLDSLIG